MTLTDAPKGRSNRIAIAGLSGVGLIITSIAAYSAWVKPALRIEAPDGDRYLEISDRGAIGVGSGATPFGNTGDCLKSGGGSGNQMTFGTCGSGGGGTSVNTGAILNAGNDRFVNVSGDTMTGRLTIDLTAGLVGLNVVEMASGAIVHGHKTLSSSGTLVFEGAASGASLYVATSIQGSGLTDCDAAAQTLNWDASTGRFSCGTDQDTDTNTTYTAGKGLGLTSTSFSLNSTITGALVSFTTVSGALVKAVNTVASSGTLVWEGAGSGSSLYLGTSLNGAGLSTCSGGNKLLWSGGRFSCAADVDTNTTYTAGQNLGLNGTAFSLNTTITGSVARGFTTISGALVRANTLASSGSLVWEGSASGATLYVATSINGSGLTDCDLATQTLAWDSTSGRFSCGTDSDTTYTAGQGLTLTSTSFKVNGTLTGTLLEFDTVSGALVWANTLRSSGSLVWEGAGSGSSLYVATSIRGSGLSDCDTAGTSKLLWDTTSGRFSCGTDTDTDTNTTYTAGQGLQLLSTSFRLADTVSGSLLEFQTVSGSLVWGNTLRSSGSVVWEGSASGATLYAATSIKGSGLVDCDTAATSKLLYDLATGRFSCGTDQSGAGTDLTRETPSGSINGSNVTFTLSTTPVAGSEVLFLNGQLQEQGASSDYTISGDTITFADAPPSGSVLTAIFGLSGDVSPVYTAGQGLSLISTMFRLNSTVTGSVVQALNSLASSGSLSGKGTATGAALNAAGGQFLLSQSGSFIWNEAGRALDFRLEGDTIDALFVLDGSADRIGIGTRTPDTTLDVVGTISGSVVTANTLRSSGSIVAEGTISGAYLTVTEVSPRHMAAELFASGSAVTTGSGKIHFFIPPTMSGWDVVAAQAKVNTAGTTNTMTIQVTNNSKGNRKLFTGSGVSVDSAEKGSETALRSYIINTSNDDVGGYDVLSVDVTRIHSTAAKGLYFLLTLRKP